MLCYENMHIPGQNKLL